MSFTPHVFNELLLFDTQNCRERFYLEKMEILFKLWKKVEIINSPSQNHGASKC